VSPEACLIDEFGPLPVVRPASVADLGQVVRQAAAQGQAVYPIGGRTQLGFGLPPSKPGVALDLSGLTRVLDYPARDMTITVQAGISLAALQEVLAAENQRLPLDIPQPEGATLGGVLATNASGPHRFGFGTARDYVIGISVVNDEGHEVKAGGRVVKNVAGYDLCKLHIGALGTLGVITQVTLKLRPRPERDALLSVPCAAADVGALLERVHASRTRPVCIELLNPAAVQLIDRDCGEDCWAVLVGYEDNADAVTWQVQQLIRELCPGRHINARVSCAAAPLWRRLADLAGRTEGLLTFKANLPPSAVADFCGRTNQLAEGLLLQAHAGNGIVLGHLETEQTAASATGLLKSLRELAAASGGQVIVLRCPAAWKAEVSVWGPPRGDAALMRAVKEKLDPRRLFNPGRFVDGI
jgi:glycolate oxidase FAD binding subunit